MHTYIYIYIYIHTHAYTYTAIHIHVHIHIHMHMQGHKPGTQADNFQGEHNPTNSVATASTTY